MKFIKIIILMLLSFLPLTGWCSDLNYKLEVAVNTKDQTIHGKALLMVSADIKVRFSINNLLKLNINGNTPFRVEGEKFSLMLKKGIKTESGKFGAKMKVSLINDGPVTIIIEK